jgi:hypothetical protein
VVLTKPSKIFIPVHASEKKITWKKHGNYTTERVLYSEDLIRDDRDGRIEFDLLLQIARMGVSL